jgi:hypothetical protein
VKLPALMLVAALAAPGVLAQAPAPRPAERPSAPSTGLPEPGPAMTGTVAAPAAVLRGLDKIAGAAQDIPLRVGESANFGRLTITLTECRYPAANPAADGFAHLIVHDSLQAAVVFRGWMIASSPALNALDHPRFDVWLIRCSSS